MDIQDQLPKILGVKNKKKNTSQIDAEILNFQKKNNLIIPENLKECFRILADNESQYNEDLYRFFPLKDFKGIHEQLKDFNGVPDYSNIVNTLSDYKNCFVFADYMFHMFSYAIRLNINESQENEIYIICGDKYRVIANSFDDFIALYVAESIELQFND